MEDIIGFLTLVVPFVFMFVFFGWLYKEEKRREQLRIQRNEEWKKEIQKFRDTCKRVTER
jgi:preprotein translocase subunit YajC